MTIARSTYLPETRKVQKIGSSCEVVGHILLAKHNSLQSFKHCWLGDRKANQLVKRFVGGDNLTGAFARVIAPVVTTPSIILS